MAMWWSNAPIGTLYCFADRHDIIQIVVTVDAAGANLFDGHDARVMAEYIELPSPQMGATTGFNTYGHNKNFC